MRITGGQARGIPLQAPKGDRVRPATDGMRQAVFSSLGSRVVGSRFLDLFAGTGAYGLEAWSRGAIGGRAIEKDSRTAQLIATNIAVVARSLGQSPTGLGVTTGDALTVPWPDGATTDLVFVDPPYELIPDLAPGLFARLLAELDLARDPLVIFEGPGGWEFSPPGWVCRKRLGKGRHQPSVGFWGIV